MLLSFVRCRHGHPEISLLLISDAALALAEHMLCPAAICAMMLCTGFALSCACMYAGCTAAAIFCAGMCLCWRLQIPQMRLWRLLCCPSPLPSATGTAIHACSYTGSDTRHAPRWASMVSCLPAASCCMISHWQTVSLCCIAKLNSCHAYDAHEILFCLSSMQAAHLCMRRQIAQPW